MSMPLAVIVGCVLLAVIAVAAYFLFRPARADHDITLNLVTQAVDEVVLTLKDQIIEQVIRDGRFQVELIHRITKDAAFKRDITNMLKVGGVDSELIKLAEDQLLNKVEAIITDRNRKLLAKISSIIINNGWDVRE